MSHKHITKSIAAALLVAAALSGCGDSGEDVAEATSSPAVAATTAGTTPEGVTLEAVPQPDTSKPVGKKEGRWAEQLCTALVGRVSAIKPPQVDTSSPEGTMTSLRTFFGDVVEEQNAQLKTLEEVGAPPGSKAASEWKKAVSELRGVRSDVSGVVDDLEAASASNAEEVQAVVAKLGTQLKSISSYGGPVAALFSNPTIGPALQREPTCERFS